MKVGSSAFLALTPEYWTESRIGVQDMACDTFIKIANKCRRHFVTTQLSEAEPFIDEIVRNMRKITVDLTPQQVHTFYEACGFMISAQGQKSIQERLIQDLMSYPNQAVRLPFSSLIKSDQCNQWDVIIHQANIDPSSLEASDTIKVVGNIMKTNVAACSSIGSYFYPQIGRIYHDMLSMYRATSQMISDAVTRDGTFPFFRLRGWKTDLEQGLIATKMPRVRGLRTIKKEILKLIDIYVQKSDDLEAVNMNIVPPLLDAVLIDYNRNVPDARDAEVLNVMTTVVTKLHVCQLISWKKSAFLVH